MKKNIRHITQMCLALGIILVAFACHKDEPAPVPVVAKKLISTDFGRAFVVKDTIFALEGDTFNISATYTQDSTMEGSWFVTDTSIIKCENDTLITLSKGTTTLDYTIDGHENRTFVVVKENTFCVGEDTMTIDRCVDAWLTEKDSKGKPYVSHELHFMPNSIVPAADGWFKSGRGCIAIMGWFKEGSSTYQPIVNGKYEITDDHTDYMYILDRNFDAYQKNPIWVKFKLDKRNPSFVSVRTCGMTFEFTWKGIDRLGNQCSLYYLGEIKPCYYTYLTE